MQGKYKFVFLFLATVSLLFSQEEKRNISFVINTEGTYSNKIILRVSYLVDIAETKLAEKYASISIRNINGEVDFGNQKRVINYIFSNGIDAVYYINIIEGDASSDVELKLYNSIGNIIHEDKINLLEDPKADKFISKEKEEEWLGIIYTSYEKTSDTIEKWIARKAFIRKNFKFEHDFPILSFGVSAISTKIYFDERMSTKIQKIFSFFPVTVKLAFFPLKYFETGVFCRFDFNNMVFRYLNNSNDKFEYFDANFVFTYGFFLGGSFFMDNAHYSIGISMYNLFYDITEQLDWKKPKNINGNFLPQFSIYQKLDFKLFKILYFSLGFDFKTLPLFVLDDNVFHSSPFLYDFFAVEISFVGLTIIF